jgi:hypothetical protein
MSKRIWEQIGKVPSFNMGQHSRLLRALLLDTDAITQSARLITVERTGELKLTEDAGV